MCKVDTTSADGDVSLFLASFHLDSGKLWIIPMIYDENTKGLQTGRHAKILLLFVYFGQ